MTSTDQKKQGGSLLRRVKSRAMKAGVPLSATLELTERCNLRCRHCYIVNDSNKRELDLEDWKNILDQLADQGALFLTITGGEPLFHKDFFDIVSYARSKEFSFVLFTNGTLITGEIADRIRSLAPQRVEISILGGRPETHDAITGVEGSFESAVRGARLLIERDIDVQMKSTWMRANIDEAGLIRALAAEIGAAFREGFLLLNHRSKGVTAESCEPTIPQLETMANNIMGRNGQNALAPPPPLTDDQKRHLTPCGAGNVSCCIDPRGDLTPCVALRIKLGNVLETPIGRIWRESDKLEQIRKIRVNDLPECRSCKFYLSCKRCAGIAMAETGDMLAASPQACRIAQVFDAMHRHEPCSIT